MTSISGQTSGPTVRRQLEDAMAHHQAGRLPEAAELYEAVLARQPDEGEALHLSGVLALQQGRMADAHARIARASTVLSEDSDVWRNLGTACLAVRDEPAAAEAFERAIALRPRFRGAILALVGVYSRLGRLDRALEVLEGLGEDPDGLSNQAALLNALGRHAEALDCADRAIAVAGDRASVESLVNRGVALRGLERPGEALPVLREALALDEGGWAARLNLAGALTQSGDWRGAIKVYGRQAADLPGLALASAATLPVIPASEADITEARERFREGLRSLREKEAFLPDPNALSQSLPPFHLAYQGQDDTALMADIADTLRAICPALAYTAPEAQRAPASGRRRIGVLSHYFTHHTTGEYFAGLIRALCARPELEVVIIGFPRPASETWEALAAAAAETYVLPRDLARARAAIAGMTLDVLLYVEVGMDSLTFQLAHARLAPVQAMLYGHPVTSGLPSMDYFLSPEALEASGGEAHYRERLVRLPGLLSHVPRRTPAEADRTRLNLPEKGTLYFCGQSLFKIHPRMDDLFRQILEGDGNGWLCLFRAPVPEVTALMEQRLAAAGLPMDRVVWLRRTRRDIFLAAVKAMDVVLDTLHFSGGQTSYDAFSVGAPVVTMAGTFLRGRQTAGLYRHMGLGDVVARTPDAYVRQALALGTDRDRRRGLSNKILAAAPGLFEDTGSIAPLVAFLASARPIADSGTGSGA